MYHCSECGETALESINGYVRACDCVAGNIVMEMSGTAYGRGTLH